MEIAIKIIQFIFSLTILVLVHELGHFCFARLFKTRVEKFQMFFGKPLWKKKIGDTQYGIGWLPLGGFVKIAGMIDESMDTDQMKQPAQPWEFRSKPPWQRLLMMVGGVLFNFVFAWIIYSASMFAWGEEYLPNRNVEHGVVCDDIAKKIGFKDGDKILRVYGEEPEAFYDINVDILLNAPGEVEVLRDGREVSVSVSEAMIGEVIRETQEETNAIV